MSEFYGEKGPVTRGDYIKGEAKGREYTEGIKRMEKPYRYLLKVPIIMHNVSSTNVSRIGYDPSNWVLQIEFLPSGKRGYRMYRYFRVPQSVATAFGNAHSKGTFVWKFIRGIYAYKEVSAGTLWATMARLYKRIARR